MNRELAQWYLDGVNAFLEDPQLAKWNDYFPRDIFLFHLKRLLKDLQEIETLEEAKSVLEKIINDPQLARSIPEEDTLKFWQQELKKAKEEKRKINEAAVKKVNKLIEEWEKLAAAKKPEAILPLAREIPKEEKVIPPPSEALPQEVIEKLATEEEGVAFVPIFTLLQPKVAFSFAKKVVLTPVVKTIQLADRVSGEKLLEEVEKSVPQDRRAVLQFRELLHQGLTAEDVKVSIAALGEAGLPPDSAKLVELEKKRVGLENYEKTHRLFTGILKQYHEFSKITGRRQVYLPELGSFLPRLSQLPLWSKKSGYSWTLRQTLTKIGTSLHFYQKSAIAPEKTVVHFSLPDTFTKVLTFGRIKAFQTVKSAIYQKALKPILAKIGGETLKKASAWILSKLGLASLPEPISKVLLGVSLVWDAAKFIWEKAKPVIKKLGLVLLGAAFALAGLAVGLPLGIAFFGISALLLGTAIFGPTFWAGLTAGVGAFASQTTAILTGIFSSLFVTPSSAAPVVALVLGTFGFLAGLTFFIVMTTAGAFILPVTPKGAEVGPMPTVAPSLTGIHLAEQIVYRLGECQISRVNVSTWEETKKCLEESNLPNKQIIINNFKASIDGNNSLQCVGFVAGVEQALGQAFPQDRNAREYLERVPSGYQRIVASEAKVGDLAVWRGTRYGHIAVVVRKEGNVKIVVAQAWGDDIGLDGRVNLTETTIDNPSGFLRPL